MLATEPLSCNFVESFGFGSRAFELVACLLVLPQLYEDLDFALGDRQRLLLAEHFRLGQTLCRGPLGKFSP